MRVRLARRRGSLAAVATLLGQWEVDIARVQTALKDEHGSVVDFLLELPDGLPSQPFWDAIATLDGVTIQRISTYRWGGGLRYDLEVMQRMRCSDLAPAHVLATSAPLLVDARWSLLLDTSTLDISFRTPLTPELTLAELAGLAPFDASHTAQVRGGGDRPATFVAVISLPSDQTLVVGRPDGPPFVASELARLSYLAAGTRRGGEPRPAQIARPLSSVGS